MITVSGCIRTAANIALLVGAGLLASCGGRGETRGATLAAGPRWDATDACKTIDKAVVASVTGQQVKETTSSPPQAGAPAAVSSCIYNLSGGAVTIMTRVSQEDMSDAEIEQFNGAGGLMAKGEEVPGYGIKAWWSPQTRQLQIVRDRRHYAGIVYGPALTLPGTPTPPEPDPKVVALELGKKLV